MEAWAIEMLVNRGVEKRGRIVGFIIMCVDNTVCRVLGGVGWEYGEDVMALFDCECIFAALLKFESRAVQVIHVFVSRH